MLLLFIPLLTKLAHPPIRAFGCSVCSQESLMSRKWFSVFALTATAILFCGLLSCAFNQHLTSIQVVPNSATFGGVGAAIQLKAIGTYQHPPQTKDITATATWSIDSQNLVQFTSGMPGLVTSISDCGSGNVIAS